MQNRIPALRLQASATAILINFCIEIGLFKPMIKEN
jgi:hypothetical protein